MIKHTIEEIGKLAIELVRAEDIEDIALTSRASIGEATDLIGVSLVISEDEEDNVISKHFAKVYIPIEPSASEFEQACSLGAYLLYNSTIKEVINDDDELKTVYRFAAYALVPWLVNNPTTELTTMITIAQRTDIPFEALRIVFG